MNTITQTTLSLTTHLTDKEQIQKTWAFAKDLNASRRKKRSWADYRNCVITACSPHAKALGIQVGMKYQEAKTLIPQIRILVIGGGNV